jgi:hypothetical protein
MQPLASVNLLGAKSVHYAPFMETMRPAAMPRRLLRQTGGGSITRPVIQQLHAASPIVVGVPRTVRQQCSSAAMRTHGMETSLQPVTLAPSTTAESISTPG